MKKNASNSLEKEHSLEKLQEMVKKYGQSSCSYLALEEDKKIYFGKKVEGLVAYGQVGCVCVVCGDPICAPEDFTTLLEEFQDFYQKKRCRCIFMDAGQNHLDDYQNQGLSFVKSGEEALFELKEYSLSGSQKKKLRNQLKYATKAQLKVHEYKPQAGRDMEIEAGIKAVSSDWVQTKKSSQLGFTIGDVGLEMPLDRRYFYARDQAGQIVAFNVFLPFARMNGYVADVTRRLSTAPRGVTELLTYEGFMTFKEEGFRWGSLGPTPLVNLREEGHKLSLTLKFLELVYEKGNAFFGFKDLHRAKRKYSPTDWVPRYLVFSTKMLTPSLAYAMIKVQNPGGLKDYIRVSLKKKRNG